MAWMAALVSFDLGGVCLAKTKSASWVTKKKILIDSRNLLPASVRFEKTPETLM
jgi:hypothetical protein